MLETLLVDIGPASLLAGSVIVFLAAVVQTGAGMGFGQVAAPCLLLLDARFVPAPIMVMALVVGTVGALRDRAEIAPDELGVALCGRVIGALAAAQILMLIPSRDGFSLLFAGLILAAVALSLARWRVRPTRRSLLVAGTLSGLMGTVTTIGAPPMGIVYQHAPGARTRGTLNAFFALGALVSLGALAIGGFFTGRDLVLAAILSPGFVAGTWAGRQVTRFVDRRFRPLVLAISICSAILIVARTLAN
jgi:uncharacterized membrane protein YfcA